MIAVLADDLSGAAELGGIAAAHGFKAEVQTVFDPRTDADVIAIDTDTRQKSESEAARILENLTRKVAAARPEWIYKKTDSVLRGHVRAEIEAILQATGLTECLHISANPSKGRVIRGGRYFIDDVPLDETVFARDPDHPRRSSIVRELLGHSPRIHTPDAASLDSLKLPLKDSTLAAGAADFFSARLGQKASIKRQTATTRSLLICGSLTAWEMGRATQMKAAGFEIKTLGEAISPALWQDTNRIMLAIGRADGPEVSSLTEKLVQTALPLISDPAALRIGLEGGATAIALIRKMGWTRFEVLPEGHTGVGSLRPAAGPVLCVKPGSYSWPEGSI